VWQQVAQKRNEKLPTFLSDFGEWLKHGDFRQITPVCITKFTKIKLIDVFRTKRRWNYRANRFTCFIDLGSQTECPRFEGHSLYKSSCETNVSYYLCSFDFIFVHSSVPTTMCVLYLLRSLCASTVKWTAAYYRPVTIIQASFFSIIGMILWSTHDRTEFQLITDMHFSSDGQ